MKRTPDRRTVLQAGLGAAALSLVGRLLLKRQRPQAAATAGAPRSSRRGPRWLGHA